MFLHGPQTPLLKVDAEIPISMMYVTAGGDGEYKVQRAWDEFIKQLDKCSYGSINELWNNKDEAAFVIMEAGRKLHHTTRKQSGVQLFAELGIKLLDTHKGQLLEESMIKAGDAKRIDFFLRGSVDMTDYGHVDSITFREVTAMCPDLDFYDSEMNKIFNKSLLPYASHETVDKYQRKQFPFHKHSDRFDQMEEMKFVGKWTKL